MADTKQGAGEPKKCRGCGQPLTPQTDSAAHVFPNALGGRLKPRGILCRTCNETLGRVADKALIEAFGAWPTFLNLPRDDGEQPPKVVDTQDGRRARVEADGRITYVDVQYDVSELDVGQKVSIGAGNEKTFKELLNRAKKQFPQFDPVAGRQAARVVGVDDDALRLTVNFHPKAVFGGLVAAVWLYLIHTTGRSFLGWSQLLTRIANMQKDGGTFRYLLDGLPGLTGPEIPLGHKLVIRTVPLTGELIAYVEVLGVLRVGGVFTSVEPPVQLVEHVYAYDLNAQADRSREFSINAAEFEHRDWRAVGLAPTKPNAPALRPYFTWAMETLDLQYRLRFAAGKQALA